MAKVISKANNTRNSRVTLSFNGTHALQMAVVAAKQNGCSWSHNVKLSPGKQPYDSFGTVSFNGGDHVQALAVYLTLI